MPRARSAGWPQTASPALLPRAIGRRASRRIASVARRFAVSGSREDAKSIERVQANGGKGIQTPLNELDQAVANSTSTEIYALRAHEKAEEAAKVIKDAHDQKQKLLERIEEVPLILKLIPAPGAPLVEVI